MPIRYCPYKPGVNPELASILSEVEIEPVVWVNFGNSWLQVTNNEGEYVINNPKAVALAANKPEASTILRRVGVFVPLIHVQMVPLIMKQVHHSGGRGIRIYLEGAPLLPKPGYYYEAYIPNVQEFRCHVIQQHSCLREKTGGTGPIKNRRNGYVFTLPGRDYPNVREASKKAVAVLGLDFGAVDVGIMEDGKVVVYEVNTAPRLEVPYIVNWYASHIIQLAKELANGLG